MSWFTPLAGLKKKICRYLLQRYLGQFLEEKLNLEQLNVDLYNGRGTVNNVALNCEALNELCENQGWGIEVTGGHIGSVTVTVPWNALMTDDSNIEVTNLYIALKPLARQTNGSSMFESMWSSMSSSLQLAQECLEKDDEDLNLNAQNATIEGLEKFAQTIDSVLNRIKAKFINTEIRLEYLPPNSDRGIAIIVKINNLDYQNEAGNDPTDTPSKDIENEDPEGQKTHLISTYATHHISIEGITFYSEEFRILNMNLQNKTESMIASEQFYSTISQLPETEQYLASENLKRTERDPEIESNPEDEKTDIVEVHSSDNVIITKLEGKQEIRIKMKQSENIYGPKVILDLQLGAFYIFLTPRQLHLVTRFCDAFLKDQQIPPKTDPALEARKKKAREMRKFLQKQKYSSMSGGLSSEGCWADPTDDNKQYSKATSSSGGFHDSPKPFEYCESLSSSMTSSSTTCSSKFRQKNNNSESSGDISHFNVRIAFVTAILMHEDILLESSLHSETPLSEESVSKLVELSNKYFNNISKTQAPHINCEKNHLKVVLTPIIIEGEEQRSSNVIILKFTTSVARADFEEILQNTSTPLIEFNRKEICSGGLHKRPEFTLTFKSTTPTGRGSKGKKSPAPKTDIHFNLEQCTVELDISLYDRLSAILSTSPFVTEHVEVKKSEGSPSASRYGEPITELRLEAPSLDIRLRFPIADSRPIHDPNRIPWWKQNIRPDFLLFVLSQFRLKFSSYLVEITANEIDLFYCENINSSKIHVGKSIFVDNSRLKNKEPFVDYPRIAIEFPSEKTLRAILKCALDDSDSGETSGESYALFSKKGKDPVPFSSKRVCRQSDTPHPKDDMDESETILLPGESREIRKFCDRAIKTSKLQFKVFLPVASAQINSKHLYEILYNRLNTDLLMWEPSAPNFSSKVIPTSPAVEQSLLNVGMMESMYVPSPTIENESESTSLSDEDETDDSDNLYYSLYDRKRSKKSQPSSSISLSTCSFQLDVNQGLMTLYAPVRDSENRVIPGQLGEFMFKAEAFSLFSVSGFGGNENIAYLCIQSKIAEIFHCGLIPHPESDPPLRLINTEFPEHLQATLYPTPENLTLGKQKGTNKREQLSFVVEIKRVPEQRIKRLRITTGIQNTTLKHNAASSQHTWLNQMIDIFDVLDYPIEGYKPYGIVTEMQLHLWDCSIDYRPMNFDYRAVAELGSFMISSNLTTSVSGCTLRFIAEDCALALAPYDYKSYQNKPQNKITALPSNDLVSVLDVGLLDISLRLNERATDLFPKFDMRASIQDMHIRTCSDSGRALAQLIAYLAADGDLKTTNEEEGSNATQQFEGEAELLCMKDSKQFFPEITEQQQERVNILMAEALKENVSAISESDDDDFKSDKGVEVFFFPDETQQIQMQKEKEQQAESSSLSDTSSTLKSTRKSSDSPETLKPAGALSQRSNSDEWNFNLRRESESSNELRDILNFETSVMSKSCVVDDEITEALPQVKEDLGEIPPLTTNKVSGKQSRRSSFNLDDFYLIAEEEKAYMSKCGIKDIKISDDPLRIVDNHFSLPSGKPDLLKAPENFPMAVMRYTLCEMTLTWHLYGGHDFPKDEEKSDEANSKKETARTYKKTMSDAYKIGVSYSKSQQSVQFGNNNKPIAKMSWKTRGGFGRNHDVLIEIQLTKVRLSHEIYPTHTTQASRQVLVISELEIRDRLQSSEINKFLYHPSAKHLPNKSSQHMVVIKALHIRPNPQFTAQECSLRISLLPLRLNIDQDALLFLVQFFNELSSTSEEEESVAKKVVQKSQPPVMMVDEVPEAVQDLQARQMVSTNLDLLMEGDEQKGRTAKEPVMQDTGSNLPIYFREVVFSPEVLIRLDYHGRRIEMSRGPIAGLLMGLGQLQCSEIRLKKICHRHGILGVDKLLNFLFKEWLADIKKNQLPAILSGVGPMYTFVQLFQGIRDLFWLPIEQYQKDGRIVRGLQLGAQSFTARTALAALEITSRIIQLLQITAETAFDMVSPGPSVRRGRHNRKGKRKRPHRPQDIREGVANAYQIVKDGINETANTFIETTAAEHDQKGYTGAVGAVFRQIPPIVVCPVVLATQATTNVLGGVKNQLVPDAKIEAREKWKEDTD